MLLLYLQTLLVYGVITLVFYHFSKEYIKKGQKFLFLFPLFIYSFFFGLRYGVGTDCVSYIVDYEEICKYGENAVGPFKMYEKGFWYLSYYCALLHFPSELYMGIISFIQLYFSVRVFKKRKELLPYIYLAFMLTASFLSYANGLRQILALSFWLYSILFMVGKNWKKHYLLLIIAFFFHKSSALLFVFYPIVNCTRLEWFADVKKQLLILGLSILLMLSPILDTYYQYIEIGAALLNYNDYFESDNFELTNKGTYGAGFFLSILINVIVILKSKDVKKFVKFDYYTKLYDFCFIGICLRYIFDASLFLSRINYYFYTCFYIIAGVTLYYCSRREKTTFLVLFFCIALVFFAYLTKAWDNTMMYVFSWQEEYVKMKYQMYMDAITILKR